MLELKGIGVVSYFKFISGISSSKLIFDRIGWYWIYFGVNDVIGGLY